MASKQPLRFFNWKDKLTKLSIRLNKTFKHKILSKSRNVLYITCSQPSLSSSNSKADYTINIPNIQSTKQSVSSTLPTQKELSFDTKLKNLLKKTWSIYQLNIHSLTPSSSLSPIRCNNRIPNPESHSLASIPSLIPNIIAPIFIPLDPLNLLNASVQKSAGLSPGSSLPHNISQADFAVTQNKDGKKKIEQPLWKNVLDAQIGYLGVVVGDRDYTDLNSWSVVGLSEEFVGKQANKGMDNNGENDKEKERVDEDFVVKVYGDWADGRALPMPGSFAIFKAGEEGKKPFVQYL